MDRQIKWPPSAEALAITFFLSLLCVCDSTAEVRTITATGEYRMGDNDTRTDAKKLALLDAKRLALEQAGTYIESITEVKNFNLSREEMRAYTAGIVEVVEQATRDIMEGSTHVVRVNVTAKIDTAIAAKQIDALRNNQSAKVSILGLQAEVDKLRLELERQGSELATVKAQLDIEATKRKRQRTIKEILSYDLLFRALAEIPGNTGKAKQLVDQLLTLEPDNSKAHTVLGLIYLRDGKQDEVIREAQLAQRGEPDDYFAYLLVAQALREKGDLDGAIVQYQMAVRLHPDAELYRDLGGAFQAKGDLEGAVAAYLEALRFKPDDAGLHFELGNALDKKNDLNGAIAQFHALLRVRPNDVASHLRLATIHWRKKDLDNASMEANEVIRLNPTGLAAFSAYKIIGSVLAARGDRVGALKIYRGAVRMLPESEAKYRAATLRDIGSMLLDEGDAETAILEYRRALNLDPNDPLTHLYLGTIFKDQGRTTEAITELDEGLRLLSKRPKNERLLPDMVQNQELIESVQTMLQSIKR